MRSLTIFLLLSLACSSGCGRQEPTTAAAPAPPASPTGPSRKAAFAGSWYPAEPATLRTTVAEFLAAAQPVEFKGRICAVIAPHAGYEYSGRVAAWSYRQVREGAYERVIVLAPSHHGLFRGFSIMNVASYATPLGEIPLDAETCAKLTTHELHVKADRLHEVEHAVEIQLPFLQVTAGKFKLVPILVGELRAGDAEKIAAALREHLLPSTLVVISTDFTHYGPNFDYVPFAENVEENLRKLDQGAVDLILKKDYGGYMAYLEKPGPTICGRNALAILLKMLPAEAQGRLLKYDTSGHITGNFTNSVSYVSAMFTVGQEAMWDSRPRLSNDGSQANVGQPPSAVQAQARAPVPQQERALTRDEKKTLLRIARDTMEAFVRSGRMPQAPEDKYSLTPAIKAKGGAFVTLQKRHELRGCIGRIGYSETPGEALPPLYRTVALMAVEAATRDPRFDTVRPEELKEIEMEVSVLSVAREVGGPEEFEVGRHGIIIRKKGRSAVFLPQVAPEQGWNREQTLQHLCQKAGLPSDEWRKPGMTFLVFTAEVFDESLLKPGS